MPKLSTAVAVALASAAVLAAPGAAHALQDGQAFGAWTAKCGQDPQGQPHCVIEQLVKDPQSGKDVLLARLIGTKTQDGQPRIEMIVIGPLGVLLTQGVSLAVDDQDPSRVPFVQCQPIGCHTVVTLEPNAVSQMKSGQTLKVGMTLPTGQKAQVPVSLNGFTAAADALQN